MKEEKFRVAIVTVTYNDGKNLSRTLDSIRKHKKDYHDYYVIDGASCDGSVDLLKENEDIITSWISEKDKGIYDAMNKCLSFSIADDTYLLWLNAGDELLDWSEYSFPRADCVFCSVIKKTSPSSLGALSRPMIKEPYNCKHFFPHSLYMHQGFLLRKKVFVKYLYDLKIGLQAENLLMSQCIMNERYACYEQPISVFYLDGVSNTSSLRILKSYVKVADALGFRRTSLFWNKRWHLFKMLLTGIMPSKMLLYYRRYYKKL